MSPGVPSSPTPVAVAQAKPIDTSLAAPAGDARSSDIKHVAVLMQGKRSFDLCFSTLPGVAASATRPPTSLPFSVGGFRYSGTLGHTSVLRLIETRPVQAVLSVLTGTLDVGIAYPHARNIALSANAVAACHGRPMDGVQLQRVNLRTRQVIQAPNVACVTVPVAQRVPNHTLRAIRLALRMSQSEFASAVRHAGGVLGEPNTCNKRLVQKWESGEHTDCRPNYKRALQAVTRTPYEQLGFSGAAAPLPDAPLLTGRLGGVLHRHAAQPLPGVVGEPGDRLRFALERPGHVDNEAIAIVETNTERLFALEHHRAARTIAGAVNRHIDDVARLLAGTRREPVRRRLAVVGGRSAALAGWLAFDRGDAASAHQYWDSSLAAARYAADGPLLACVLTYLSYSAAERGDPATAWQLAHTAVSHAGRDPRARAWMAGRAAEEAATLGERAAALSELELALSLGSDLPTPTPDDDTLPWLRFFDTKRLAAIAANVHGRLGDVQAAVEAAEWAMRTLGTEQVKVRAVVLAEVACAAARAGQLDLVEQVVFEAADLADGLEVTLARRKLRALLQLLGPYRASVIARRVVDRLDVE